MYEFILMDNQDNEEEDRWKTCVVDDKKGDKVIKSKELMDGYDDKGED